MRYEVTIVATNTVLIDADNEDDAHDKALALGVWKHWTALITAS